MSVAAVLLPVFALVLLAFGLGGLLAVRRAAAVKAGEVKQTAIIGDTSAWPKPAILASNAFQNQFEMPVLFYALTLAALASKQADMAFVVMAWAFVATRYLHAFVHVTSNLLPWRFGAFIAGVLILAIMWIVFAARIFSGG